MSRIYMTEPGARLGKKGGYYVISRENEKVLQIPAETVEGVTLIDSAHITPKVMIDCLERGIPITYLSGTGRYFGRVESTKHKNILREQEQFLLYENLAFRLPLAKRIIFGKVYNQRTVLIRYNRNKKDKDVTEIIQKMRWEADKIHQTENIEQIMGYEGHIAKMYFFALGKLVDDSFFFTKRTKQPPKDKFNSLLSFGYTLLMYDFYTALTDVGLNPYIGCLHALKNGHPALASDLMEPWRAAVVDTLVLSLVSRGEMLSGYFDIDDSTGGVYLNRIGRKIFIQKYENKMKTTNRYFENPYSWRHTIRLEAASYALALHTNDYNKLKPMIIR